MVKRDLDVLGDKSEDSITLFGKERNITRLKVKEYVEVQALVVEMSQIIGKSEKEIDTLETKTWNMFHRFIPSLTRKEFDKMNFSQKMNVFSFIDELFLIDQGVPEERVSDIKKQLENQRMNILLQNIGNAENIS